jgi:hypothetical protein
MQRERELLELHAALRLQQMNMRYQSDVRVKVRSFRLSPASQLPEPRLTPPPCASKRW